MSVKVNENETNSHDRTQDLVRLTLISPEGLGFQLHVCQFTGFIHQVGEANVDRALRAIYV